MDPLPPNASQSAEPEVVFVTDPWEKTFVIPIEAAKTWEDILALISNAHSQPRDETLCQKLSEGAYDITGPDGSVILPQLWASFVRPGLRVTIALWDPPGPLSPSLRSAPPAAPSRQAPSRSNANASGVNTIRSSVAGSGSEQSPQLRRRKGPPPGWPPLPTRPRSSIVSESAGSGASSPVSPPRNTWRAWEGNHSSGSDYSGSDFEAPPPKRSHTALSWVAKGLAGTSKKKRPTRVSPPSPKRPLQRDPLAGYTRPDADTYGLRLDTGPPDLGAIATPPKGVEPGSPPAAPESELVIALSDPRGEAARALEESYNESSGDELPASKRPVPNRRGANIKAGTGAGGGPLQKTAHSPRRPVEIQGMTVKEFREARIYLDETESTGSRSISLIETTDVTKDSAPKMGSSRRLKCIHVSRDVLNLDELEEIALHDSNMFDASTDRYAIAATRLLLDKFRRQTFSRSDGTVLSTSFPSQGIPGAAKGNRASATLISVPLLYVDTLRGSAAGTVQAPGWSLASAARGVRRIFRPAKSPEVGAGAGGGVVHGKFVRASGRLHEVFNMRNKSLERDKAQALIVASPPGVEEIIWVGYVWILAVDGFGIITYGSQHAEHLLEQNMTQQLMSSPSSIQSPKVEVTNAKGHRIELPLKRLSSFYVLRQIIEEENARHGDQEIYGWRLVDSSGNEVDYASWPGIVNSAGGGSITLRLKRLDHARKTAFPSGTVATTGQSGPLEGEEESTEIVDSSGGSLDDTAVEDGDVKTPAGKISKKAKSVAEKQYLFFNMRGLDSSIAPFGVSPSENSPPPSLDTNREVEFETSEKETTLHMRSLNLHRIMASLKADPSFVIDTLIQEFPNIDLDLSVTTKAAKEVLDIPRLPLRARKLAMDFGQAATTTLEIFTTRDPANPLMKQCEDSIARMLQASIISTPAVDPKTRWILRPRISDIVGVDNIKGPADPARCRRCSGGRIYTSRVDALRHLQKRHTLSSTPLHRLEACLVSLAEAGPATLDAEYVGTLDLLRDTMARLCERSFQIQLVIAEIQRTTGETPPRVPLPQAVAALALIYAYIMSVPLLLDEIEKHYVHDVHLEDAKYLELPWKLRYKRVLVEKVGMAARNCVKAAGDALDTPLHIHQALNGVRRYEPVGMTTLAARMLSNLVQDITHRGRSVSDIYEACCEDWSSEVLTRAMKPQVLAIGAFTDEVRKLKKVAEWQLQACSSFRHLPQQKGGPSSFWASANTGSRAKERRQDKRGLEGRMMRTARKELQERVALYNATLERSAHLVSSVRELTEIMRDKDNKAVVLFTLITVIFLPLSFVASYLSMSDGPAGDDWDGVQGLFWKTAGPLAAVIGVFCLLVSWNGSTVQAARRWTRRAVGKDRSVYDDGYSSSTSSDYI